MCKGLYRSWVAAFFLLLPSALPLSNAEGASLPLIDHGEHTFDPNTGLLWLDLTYSADMAFDVVQATLLGPSRAFAGYRYATTAEVTTLFVNADITNFAPHGADAAIAHLVDLLGGPTFLPGPGFGGLGGMTADEYLPDPSYVYWMILMSGTSDGTQDSLAGIGGIVGKAGPIAADTYGSFLVRDVSSTPLPGTLPLFVTGLGMIGLFAWRRNRKKDSPVALPPASCGRMGPPEFVA